MAHYLDFVGLNTFIYEPVGWSPEEQFVGSNDEIEKVTNGYSKLVEQNTIGSTSKLFNIYQISHWKNYLFSHELPTTASFFPALMLRRNGPYGFPTWKQIRISENPLSRKQRKENVFTFITEPGDEVIMNNDGKLSTIRGKYGSIQKYTENPVSSRYKPFVVGGAAIVGDGELERFEIVGSYGNETIFFNNEEINKYNGLRVIRSNQYNTIKDFYLNGGLDKDGSPIDSFEYLKYGECVYPPRIYQYKNYVRQRTTFSFPWRDERQNRTQIISITDSENNNPVDFFYSNARDPNIMSQSVWPLDTHTDFDTTASATQTDETWKERWGPQIGDQNPIDDGILMNHFSFGNYYLPSQVGWGSLKNYLSVMPRFTRPHTVTLSSSVVSPNGMNIEGINTGTQFNDIDLKQIPGGDAKWEAGSQSGLNPFYDSYDKYIQGVKQIGKEYSIIPEFRISEHVETYQEKGLTEEVSNLFSLTGALSNTADSSKNSFYTIYSTSEFMKHFEVVKEDHKEFVPASSISLKCKAIKKFLPYEGFYPAQRSVDLAKQFFNSYKDFISINAGSADYGTPNNDFSYVQNLMVPTFAPGIFFNTIKSGIAVDYPLIDSNLEIGSDDLTTKVKVESDNYYIRGGTSTPFDRRIPFEALVEPEKHLAGFDIYCNEPHLYANNSGSVMWSGEGNKLYKLMANNFLAEVSDFFMKKKSFTSISSRPSSDPNVGKMEAGKKYIMRIKMYKSKDEAVLPFASSSGGFYIPPQYPSSSTETFTMYSRPSAFGPPVFISGSDSVVYEQNMAGNGENYSFTPPYYNGEAWADITFIPSTSKKYSIQEIISGSTVSYYRYAQQDTTMLEFAKALHIKNNGLQLDASVNLFSQSDFVAEQVSRGQGIVLPNSNDNPSRWVIQTKFETPMLNFNHLSASDSITLPNNASQSVPRGMWHQYGLIEEDATKGIFLQVDDVPTNWIDEYLEEDSATYESLVDVCGFSTEAHRLGEIAEQKRVFEAVVAVPFIEEDGERKFFRIPRVDIQRAFGERADRALVGDSVLKMIVKMQKYVMPPPMDFLNNDTIDPFAMYIFEFSHTFKKQDLANIWQNLYPKIGQTFEIAESSISHELLAHELLGGGAQINPEGTLDVNAVGNEMPDRVRWMVFKVKQRAETNYFKKIVERNDTNIFEEGDAQVSYNWPYDFFSLVELAKIESEVKFAEREIKPDQQPRETIVPKTSTRVSRKAGSARNSEEIRNEGRAAAQAIRRRRTAERRGTERLGGDTRDSIAQNNADTIGGQPRRQRRKVTTTSGGDE